MHVPRKYFLVIFSKDINLPYLINNLYYIYYNIIFEYIFEHLTYLYDGVFG